MNYIGSKKKLLPFLESVILEVTGSLEDKTFSDLFSGTAIVASHFKGLAKEVYANDFEYYAYVLGKNYLEGKNVDLELIDELNAIPDGYGFISENYSLGGSDRMYFTEENALVIDAVRSHLEGLWENGDISEVNYFFGLCSILESADKVANTASVYGAYLKKFKASAQKDLVIAPALPVFPAKPGKMNQAPIQEIVSNIKGDVVYLDPPYNARQYGSNYHMLNTIAHYKEFIPKGITGLPEYQRSEFCSKVKVKKAFENLLDKLNFKYIFISYNNEGILPLETLQGMLSELGTYTMFDTEHQRFKADTDANRNTGTSKTIEYLHVVERVV